MYRKDLQDLMKAVHREHREPRSGTEIIHSQRASGKETNQIMKTAQRGGRHRTDREVRKRRTEAETAIQEVRTGPHSAVLTERLQEQVRVRQEQIRIPTMDHQGTILMA